MLKKANIMYENYFEWLKPFNSFTISEDFIAELCGLVAWNNLTNPKYKNNNTFIVRNLPAIGIHKNGKGKLYPWDDSKKELYNRTEMGIEIFITVTKQKVTLYNTGRVTCVYTKESLSDYEHISRNKYTGEESPLELLNYSPNPTDLINLYIKYNFLKIK